MNCLQNKPEFNQVCEAFSMEVMGSKLAAGLTPQQIYLCHRTWGLLLEASVQKAAEAFLASVFLLRKINGHGDEGFEKFDSEMKVGFGSYIMGTHAARLIGTNTRSEEEVERSPPAVEASSKEISRPALDVEFIDGPDMSVKVSSTIKILAAAKSKDEDESEEDKDDDDEDDDNEEDLGEEGDEDVSSEDGGEEHNEGNGTGGAGEEDEDDEEDDEDGNDNNEKAGSDEDEEDEDDEDEVVEEEEDHGEEGEEEDEDDDGEDEDEKDDEEDEDEESLQPPKKRKK